MTAEVLLSSGGISLCKNQEGYAEPVTFKVKAIERNANGKYRVTFTDGGDDMPAVLASQLSPVAESLGANALVKLTCYTLNTLPNLGMTLIVSDMEVISNGSDHGDANVAIKVGTPAGKGLKPEGAVKKEEAASPLPKTPVLSVKPEPGAMSSQTGPTPPSAAPPSISKRTSGFSHISDLHPYDDNWRLRAKLVRKAPLRMAKLRGTDTAVFSVELVDDEGSAIQGTFWRNQAERWSVSLEEGKAYIFEKFQVKPANKQYAIVRCDYEITFTDKTEVSECADQKVAQAMAAAVEHVPIDHLPKYITRKMPVDVMGVVISVGTSGTVKRKSDSTELARRDLTIADKSGKTVSLTLWGDNVSKAAELEGQDGQVVIQVTAVRVTDYNGCSLSTLNRSVLTVSPDIPAAHDMLSWWASEGSNMSLMPVGGDAAQKASGQGGGFKALSQLKDVVDQPVPELDAKPAYHNTIATVAYVNPDSKLYYLANPENGRKVTERDGQYITEDGTVCERPTNRYVLNVKMLDQSGEAYVNAFSELAELMMGMSADDLNALKLESEDRFKSAVKAAQFTEWTITIQTKGREYQGERKMRHTVFKCEPVDFVKESKRLVALIDRYQ